MQSLQDILRDAGVKVDERPRVAKKPKKKPRMQEGLKERMLIRRILKRDTIFSPYPSDG